MEKPESYSTGQEQGKIRDLRTHNRFFVDNKLIDEFGEIIGVYGIAIYAALCRFADLRTQRCFPSYQTLADRLDCSRRKVIDVMALLEDCHIIRKARRYDDDGHITSNWYDLMDKSDWQTPICGG